MHPIHRTFVERRAEVESLLGEPVSITGLTGPLRIFQRLGGHRHSIDDAVTAWYALEKRPDARTVLDLGAGVGTVGTIVLWALDDSARMTCVEAQAVSFELLRANLACNGLADRVTAIHGDLRNLRLDARFDLVTGTPPYFAPHAGTLPGDAQKAYARFELRGDVGSYARVAATHLGPNGLFIYCFPWAQKRRGMDLVERAGLRIWSCRDVVPKRNRPPLFSVFAAGRRGPPAGLFEEPPLVVEGEDGQYSDEMLSLQATRGFGRPGTNLRGE